VFVLGLNDNGFYPLPGDASEVVRRARKFFFSGYQGKPYPHLVSLTREPLVAVLRLSLHARDIQLPESRENEVYLRYIRPTWAKVSADKTRAVLMSGDSRKIYLSHDLDDIDWDAMHYDELLLCLGAYKEILQEDHLAFLKATGAKIPTKLSTDL